MAASAISANVARFLHAKRSPGRGRGSVPPACWNPASGSRPEPLPSWLRRRSLNVLKREREVSAEASVPVVSAEISERGLLASPSSCWTAGPGSRPATDERYVSRPGSSPSWLRRRNCWTWYAVLDMVRVFTLDAVDNSRLPCAVAVTFFALSLRLEPATRGSV